MAKQNPNPKPDKPAKAQTQTQTQGLDYKGLGFMCGLEIHQRLATVEKLFCSCPATIAGDSDAAVGEVARYQRAVAGELGNIDRSAEFEELKSRRFTYRIRRQHTCLVEIDEEPPHSLNDEALGIALALAKSMKMNVVDELQPMRKEVVDGSDPSAFQRTIMVAADGMLKVNGIEINVPSMFLEEESSGIVSSAEDSVLYDTDRLGIPLIEIDTDPTIPNPKAAKDIAFYIGTLLRLTGKVQRGIGSIRQDVNVSIKEGTRVEIKGLQEIDKMDKFIENEVRRQAALIEIKKELLKRHADVGKAMDVTDIFRGTKAKVVRAGLDKGGTVIAFMLKGFKGLLGKEINPNRRLGTEISDYARAAGVGGIIHSDEDMDKYGLSGEELGELRKRLGVQADGSFIMVSGRAKDVLKAAELARQRALQAIAGVPPETRGTADAELATTKFLRPLPGGSRMYPETDARPKAITAEMLNQAEKVYPDVEKERRQLISALASEDLVDQIITSPRLPLYKAIVSATNADPVYVANVLVQKFTELKRNGIDVDSIGEKRVIELFAVYGKGLVAKQAVDELLKSLPVTSESVNSMVVSKELHKITGSKLRELVHRLAKEAHAKDINDLRNKIMAKYRLNVDGQELNDILKGVNL